MNAGPYVQIIDEMVTMIKVGSVSSNGGGYVMRAQKTTDLSKGGSKQAIKIIPNSATGVGQIIKKVSGTSMGTASMICYVDYSEIDAVIAALQKMKALGESGDTPKNNVTYTYTCRGGFNFSVGFVSTEKKSVWLGQCGETGDMPCKDFLDEMIRGFQECKAKFAELK